MLIDTHCHLNMMVKETFDTLLETKHYKPVQHIINEAAAYTVLRIINVGTSLIESNNCVALSQHFEQVYATIGIHPNDCTATWHNDLKRLTTLLSTQKNKIVGIGETGLDRHYPDYNIARQQDAFKAHIELALEYNRALIVHSRDASEETLQILDEYSGDITRCVMHCFSYDTSIAHEVITRGFLLGIGGTITYPKNNELRTVVQSVPLSSIVLETDAPFLPPQIIRGKQNHPKYIATIAEYVAVLRKESFDHIVQTTTDNALKLFNML